jgi:uncharacterized membrane protein
MDQNPNQQVPPSSDATPQGSAPTALPTPNQNRMLFGILAYIGVLIIVSYVFAKEDSFVLYHIRQGAVLFVIEVAVMLLSYMLPFNMLFFPLAPLFMIVNLGCLVLSIIGVLNVVKQKEQELPLVGHLAKHIPV